MLIIKKIIFINNSLGNNWEFDPCIFWAVHRSIQVKCFYIKALKTCAWTRKGAVYYHLKDFQRPCRCYNIPRVSDTISCHSYVRSIGVDLVRSYLTHHTSVTYILPTVVRNIFKFYYSKGVCALNTMLLSPNFAATNTLENPSKFIGIGCVPNLLIFLVTA